MKVVILAGGLGTRLSEETRTMPKPMVEIGSDPILIHIMNHYAKYGHNEFIILTGYKHEIIKDYFHKYFLNHSNVTFDLGSGSFEVLESSSKNWKVSVIFTGNETCTGGRLLQAKKYIGQETFFLTYGDGLSNINIEKLVSFHISHGRTATISAVPAQGRFGDLKLSGTQVAAFAEKQEASYQRINGGFFVFNKEIFNYLSGDSTILEDVPLIKLAEQGQLMAFQHDGFWKAMDTLKDKLDLDEMILSGDLKWEN